MRLPAWSTLLLGVLAGPGLAQEIPAWKFKAGASFILENVNRREQTVEIQGKVQTSALTTIWVSRIEVLKVGEGQIDIEQTIVSVDVKDVQPAGTKADLAHIEEWTARLKGNKLRFALSPAGRAVRPGLRRIHEEDAHAQARPQSVAAAADLQVGPA